MDQVEKLDIQKIKDDLSAIFNKSIDLRIQLTNLENKVETAFNQPTTNEALKKALDIDPDKICCKDGNTTREFSPEQYNHILGMMGGSYRDVKGKVIEKLIKDGQCFVNHKDVSITPEVLQYIKIELDPNSVGCYKYTFSLENFLATPYFQNTLKLQLEHLRKTIFESTRQFNELAYLK